MLNRLAWFVCVVLMAKKMSSNWMAVGFGVTVPASFVIWPLYSLVVTSFSHGDCVVGVKFRWNPSKLPSAECRDLGASSIWMGKRKRTKLFLKRSWSILFSVVVYHKWIIYNSFDLTITSAVFNWFGVLEIQHYCLITRTQIDRAIAPFLETQKHFDKPKLSIVYAQELLSMLPHSFVYSNIRSFLRAKMPQCFRTILT